jgi:hypothetical protein
MNFSGLTMLPLAMRDPLPRRANRGGCDTGPRFIAQVQSRLRSSADSGGDS